MPGRAATGNRTPETVPEESDRSPEENRRVYFNTRDHAAEGSPETDSEESSRASFDKRG